jgi:hypothetical protein
MAQGAINWYLRVVLAFRASLHLNRSSDFKPVLILDSDHPRRRAVRAAQIER